MSVKDPDALEVIQATEVMIGGESLDGIECDDFTSRILLENAGVDTTTIGYVEDAIERAREMASHELYEVARQFGEEDPATGRVALASDALERAAFLVVRARLLRPLTDALGGAAEPDRQLEAMSEIVAEFAKMA